MSEMNKKTVALTFDDGPEIGITDAVLDILEEHGICASFFVVGENINGETVKIMRRAHALGCEINNHSFTHSVMPEMTAEAIRDEIGRTDKLVYDAVGEYPRFFRPPYIALNSTMYENIDLPFIAGIGCDDWDEKVSVERRVEFLIGECPDGCIILLHDKEENVKTVEALRVSLPKMISGGYEFVTVSGLFEKKGITPQTDREIIYSFATVTGQMG